MAKEPDDIKPLELIPMGELHLTMSVPNLVTDVIEPIMGTEEFNKFLMDNYIMRRGYFGGTFDGNNSKKLINSQVFLFHHILDASTCKRKLW